MKKIVFGIFILILCWEAIQYWPIEIQVSSPNAQKAISLRMPLRDKQKLDFFLREVCFINVWAYTLLGSKPMSIDQYTTPWHAFRNMVEHPEFKGILLDCFWPPSLQKISHLLTPRELKMKWGWETLNKYVARLPNSQFYLGSYKKNEIVCLILVNKPNLIKTVKENIEDFQITLKNCELIPDHLFQDDKLYVFLSSLHHDGLRGTLLGYGRNNAWQFFQYQNKDPNERPMRSAWPDEEILNLERLNKKIASFQSWDLFDLFYPRFACDPNSEETLQLQKTYREEREKIIHYYKDKNLVEATLSLFCSS